MSGTSHSAGRGGVALLTPPTSFLTISLLPSTIADQMRRLYSRQPCIWSGRWWRRPPSSMLLRALGRLVVVYKLAVFGLASQYDGGASSMQILVAGLKFLQGI